MDRFPPDLKDIENEADVEQKLLWPLLTLPEPVGLGFSPADLKLKRDIRALPIGKGAKLKLYYPDYLIVIAGLPLVTIEAKSPSEDLDAGLHDTRLYAAELNALFPSGVNPCVRVLASNGTHLITGPSDTAAPDIELTHDQMTPAEMVFGQFTELLSRRHLQSLANGILSTIKPKRYFSPVGLLGGRSVRNEEIGHNSFGARIALEYRHLFNPATREERAHIVKNAYVPSRRREQYVEPIDRFIRAAAPPSVSDATTLEDSGQPSEIVTRLRKRKALEHQIMLIVGGVGAGKSTFVDYLSEVRLPADLREATVWVHTDLNFAPLDTAKIYDWLAEQLVQSLPDALPGVDLGSVDNLQKLYAVELNRLKKGALSLLDPRSTEYKTRLVDSIFRLQRDVLLTAKAMERYICAERGRLLIVVLDNCDKRNRDEQLLMFQVAQWLQQQLNCLIILPIRDVTYDAHRMSPPLDTALKDLVFRIEPPRFTRVLSARITLALKEMQVATRAKVLSYTLPNGIVVEYPVSDQAMYLNSILRSIYEYDAFIRRTIVGIAGRDMRRAMEIFLEFCTSGHISEGEILKIRRQHGMYVLPFYIVARVLLRRNRRFYDGDYAYLKNVFYPVPEDAFPDHLVRLAILRWLLARFSIPGPNSVRGYHRCSNLILDLVAYGHDAQRIRQEVLYLVREGCVVPEHLSYESVADEDLLCLSPAGAVHLRLLKNIDYLAACAESTWYHDERVAEKIAERIGSRQRHYTRRTALLNAQAMLRYLADWQRDAFPRPEAFVRPELLEALHDLKESLAVVENAVGEYFSQSAPPRRPGTRRNHGGTRGWR